MKITNKIFAFALAVLLLIGVAGQPVFAELIATPTASTVLVDGQSVAFDAYLINGNNYFKLRDLAHTLSGMGCQFEVEWNSYENAISLTSGRQYTTVGGEMEAKGGGVKNPAPTDSKILLDGVEISLNAYNIEGNNYFMLRDVGKAIGFEVDWDGAANTIFIDTHAAVIKKYIDFMQNGLKDITVEIRDASKPHGDDWVNYSNLAGAYILRSSGETPMLVCVYVYEDNGMRPCIITYNAAYGLEYRYGLHNNARTGSVGFKSDIVFMDGMFYLVDEWIQYYTNNVISSRTLRYYRLFDNTEELSIRWQDDIYEEDYYKYDIECYKDGLEVINQAEKNRIIENYGTFPDGIAAAVIAGGKPYMSAEKLTDKLFMLDLSSK